MTTLLLDASVWIAARNTRERDHAAARRLLEDEATPPLAALDLTLYEVANVAVTRWRSRASAQKLVTLIRAACPDTLAVIDESLVERAIALADEHRLSAYDAAYVAAAQLYDWTLVSGDRRDLVGPGHAIAPDAALAAG